MSRWLFVLSDILSVITIGLCLILKVPQIFRLVNSGHAAGVSLKGLILELSSYTVMMMYNYTNEHPILSYMEYPILIIQEYVLVGFVMSYKDFQPLLSVLLLGSYFLVTLAFAYNLLSKVILSFLLPLTTPVSAISKLMQLIEIMSKKNADSVSVLTWFLSFFTNVTRIYTVYMGTADINLLLNFSVSSVLSGAVMAAALYYQRKSPRSKVN